MTVRLDREMQRKMLECLRDSYPNHVEDQFIPGHEDKDYMGTLNYLHEHGLIDALESRTLDSPHDLFDPRITAKGLDFLEDDGGLSAILNTVTVRFEADTLRALLTAKLEEAPGDPAEKAKAKGLLSSLSGEALKELVHQLVGVAVAKAPEALPLILSAGKNLFT